MIFQCFDEKKLARIINHPDVSPWLVDDFQVVIHPSVIYLMNEEETGFTRTDPLNSVICSGHICVLPELRGAAIEFLWEAVGWFFKNTWYQKIVVFIPVFNERTIGFVRKFGFTQEGLLTKSCLKDWKLYDQIIFSVNKEDKIWVA